MRRAARTAPVILLLAAMLAGCIQIPRPPDPFRLTAGDARLRSLQTRYFETGDEQMMLSAVTGLLQDTGFNLDESEADLGVLVASKERDAEIEVSALETLEMALDIAAFFLTDDDDYDYDPEPVDDRQRFRASVVTRPIGDDGERIAVRVTFQRTVWNTEGDITANHSVIDPEQYKKFFAMLSTAVFLEAHDL